MRSKLVIMKHDAIKAGLHYDLRVKMPNGKYMSWRLIYDAKNDIRNIGPSSKPITLIETSIHTEDEALLTGKIPEGEYGAGTIKRYLICNVYIEKSDWKSYVVLTIMDGKFAHQKWVIFRTDVKDKIWILFKPMKKETENE